MGNGNIVRNVIVRFSYRQLLVRRPHYVIATSVKHRRLFECLTNAMTHKYVRLGNFPGNFTFSFSLLYAVCLIFMTAKYVCSCLFFIRMIFLFVVVHKYMTFWGSQMSFVINIVWIRSSSGMFSIRWCVLEENGQQITTYILWKRARACHRQKVCGCPFATKKAEQISVSCWQKAKRLL